MSPVLKINAITWNVCRTLRFSIYLLNLCMSEGLLSVLFELCASSCVRERVCVFFSQVTGDGPTLQRWCLLTVCNFYPSVYGVGFWSFVIRELVMCRRRSVGSAAWNYEEWGVGGVPPLFYTPPINTHVYIVFEKEQWNHEAMDAWNLGIMQAWNHGHIFVVSFFRTGEIKSGACPTIFFVTANDERQ